MWLQKISFCLKKCFALPDALLCMLDALHRYINETTQYKYGILTENLKKDYLG
jgi:hypothetical protein